ncbi:MULTISPECIES: hypothetical protein [unclassified Actinoplanes]|uniref:hypothetical protein n=1 Tax=unclassified Actinoplanes TaxID=2626549 RepID=UPI0005B9EF76|nr:MULTISPECIES: hypothetical protein [unclassified Actinoplanes]
MSVTDAAVAADLVPAGLEFLERVSDEVSLPLPPAPPYYSPASCGPEHGRFDSDEMVDVEDPEMPAKVNAGWLHMATEYGVLDSRREFLLNVNYSDPEEVEPEYAWVRVRLSDHWDLAGGHSTALRSGFGGLFTDRFVPEFSMLSTDHKAMLNTTVWGNGTVSTIVIRPDRREHTVD